MLTTMQDVRMQIDDLMSGRNESHKDVSHPTILKELLDSDLPPQEKSAKGLADEVLGVVAAEIETTRWTLNIISFHLLKNPKLLRTLKQEIDSALPDIDTVLTLPKLERLPYLTAVIQEGLRLSCGVTFRQARTSTAPLQYSSYIIPPGILFSKSTYYIHQNPTILPSPTTFNPSRWLPDLVTGAMPTSPSGKLLTRYLGSFSRGTRQYLGMHLAYAELYICLSNVFRKFETRLFETTVRHVEFFSDQFLPYTHPDSKGIRVTVI